jgi:hypothetical protein
MLLPPGCDGRGVRAFRLGICLAGGVRTALDPRDPVCVYAGASGADPAVCRMKNSTGSRPEADRGDRPSEPGDAGSVDGCFWDKATIHEIDAKQRKATFTTYLSRSYRCRNGTSALPSEAESRRSSGLGREEAPRRMPARLALCFVALFTQLR